jgi:hypothetical protein
MIYGTGAWGGQTSIATSGPLGFNRKTIDTDYTLTSDDNVISVSASSGDVEILLPTTPIDGKYYEIYIVNLDHNITIKGKIDGNTDLVINNVHDNIRLIYNADATYWESR